MLLSLLLLVIGFILLVRGANTFVDGAVALAHRFNVPEIIIGLTIVAMGTSAPELAVSISSALHGAGGMAIGNALGSNIINILLVLGTAALVTPLNVQQKTVRYEIPFLIFITVMLTWFGIEYTAITRTVSCMLLLFFAMFVCYLYFNARKEIIKAEKTPEISLTKTITFLCVGLLVLVFGSDLTVKSATDLANILHVPDRIIGLTLVALGTSLPELVTCVIAAHKKRTGLVIGNIIGSNIFNILFVLGITGLVVPMHFSYSFVIDATISAVITMLLWLFAVYKHKLARSAGIVFLICYIGYLIYLV